ncbi:MAG: hypothetical protein AVDCRST_MAG73-1231, partial [uncultured Thermomicrobiales bacterium]
DAAAEGRADLDDGAGRVAVCRPAAGPGDALLHRQHGRAGAGDGDADRDPESAGDRDRGPEFPGDGGQQR